MTGIAYVAAFAVLAATGWALVVAATQDRPLFYRGQHRMMSMRAALALVGDDEPEPAHAGYDPYGEPSAFDKLVGVHGYQRPAYERPGTPPPPPEPATVPEPPATHEGATADWSPKQEAHAVDDELPDVDLIRSAEEVTVVHDALGHRLDPAIANFRASMDAVLDDLCADWWFRRLDDGTFERVRAGADVPGAFLWLAADPAGRARSAAASCYVEATGEWDLSELRAELVAS